MILTCYCLLPCISGEVFYVLDLEEFVFLLPFQTKTFPFAPLSRMKQSSLTSSSWEKGLFSDTLVMVMEPVASDTYRWVKD